MPQSFPLNDVGIRRVDKLPEVSSPLYTSGEYCVSESEVLITITGVGCFYVRGGDTVEYVTEEGADPEWVKLVLESQVLVALMHQRQMINFHASSFMRNDKGIMILGETGAGKSSLTASYVMDGAGFLSDDLTAVVFRGSMPYIRPLFREIKLTGDSIQQLSPDSRRLRLAEAGTGKHYLTAEPASFDDQPLHTIIRIEVAQTGTLETHHPPPAEAFAMLRSEVCMWEMLRGMPSSEAVYMKQLLQIVKETKVITIIRPADMLIEDLHREVERLIDC